jgi:ubiquinone/menaquinone biosynthesis C-methylase UbiE
MPSATNWSWYYSTILQKGMFQDHEFQSEVLVYTNILKKYHVGDITVELGCGIARASLILLKKATMFVIGVDLNANALHYAKNLFKHSGFNAYSDFILADVKNLPIRNDSVDFVHSQGLYEHFHLDERQKVVLESIRIIKKNGWLLTFVPNKLCVFYEILRRIGLLKGTCMFPDEEPYTIRELSSILIRGGMSIVERGGIVTKSYFVYIYYVLMKLFGANMSLFKIRWVNFSKNFVGIVMGRQIYCFCRKKHEHSCNNW